jgi:predicted DNA-binding transcriptional regulator YafY
VRETAGRLLRLLPLLTARPSWRGDELADRLGVTTRTVRRDIDRLRELGYPVRAIPGRLGGYALGPGARLPPLLLDEDSAVAVALGLRAAAADPGLRGSQEAAARAAAAIDEVMPPRLRRRVEAVTAATVPLVPSEPSIEPNELADSIALHLALLGIPFTPLEPPELRDRCAVLAERLHAAAHRYPAEEPADD